MPPGKRENKEQTKVKHLLNMKVDTRAMGNTLPLRTFRQIFPNWLNTDGKPKQEMIKPTSTTLMAYNKTPIPCYGSITMPCRHGAKDWTAFDFHIVDVSGPAVCGLQMAETLGLVTMHCEIKPNPPEKQTIESIGDLQQRYPNQFDRIGEFQKEQNLVMDPKVPPHIDRPRKTPIAQKDKIKAELDSMVKQSVIRPIDEPTEWVSSLTYVTKKDGTIRVCLDPKHLNQALIRPQHRTRTIEELNHHFAGARYFSKLDAKSGYWSIKLNEESQKLTTFQTPFGRFCFQRLPFGLCVSQDIFQREMDRILEKCEGVCGIADDVAVAGSTEEQHDQRLIHLMETAAEHGLVFNSSKCHIKQTSISVFGNIYTRDGIKPDPQKVRDIKGMKTPTTKHELQQFLGMMTYLSTFIEDLSTKTSILRDLLKEDSTFLWEPHHQKAFGCLKEAVSKASLLAYYQPEMPLYLQCDASMQGLGVGLLQHDKSNRLRPIAYASKSLTPTEQRYACIERELLAIVYGTQRFHTFLYGRSFQVITDHKPLVSIVEKSLTAAPPRLQRMLLQLQGYKFSLEYKPGKENQLADALSRLPNIHNDATIDLDMRVDHVAFSTSKVSQIQSETIRDPVLNELRETIIVGWPEQMKQTPIDIRPFWSIRDQLSVLDGIIMKGHQVVIPRSIQHDILQQLHACHMGMEKTKLRAKDTVFWPNMCTDIDNLVRHCSICQEHKPSQTHEPLVQHEIPPGPWHTVGTDLFMQGPHQYLIVADYFSKFPIIRKLPDYNPSSVVITALKQIFSEHGIPRKVISDNGPHYSSTQFRIFADSWGFSHVTSSPHYPRSNGFIERQIQTMKSIMNKAQQAGTDIDLALLCWRVTPLSRTIESPAQLLMGRRLLANLPSKVDNPNMNKDGIRQEFEKQQQLQKFYHDQKAMQLPPLHKGQATLVQNTNTKKWMPAVVQDKTAEPRSYLIQCPSGKVVRRNRIHIREAPEETHKHYGETPRETPPNGANKPPTANTSSPHRGLRLPYHRGIMQQNEGTTTHARSENPPKKDEGTTFRTHSVSPLPKLQDPPNGEREATCTVRTRCGRAIRPPSRYED